ncbi:MAG: tight adherence protein [Actinomycetota bacterium]|jgi:tight adherence protein B|nr:tight adherence protein [Actinomycetota bacterium]
MLAVAHQFIGSDASRVLIAGITGLAMAALVISLVVIFGRRQAGLERRLAGYEKPDSAFGPNATEGNAPESSVVQQAVRFTERFATRHGFLARTELLLEQADLPLRPAEALFYVPTFAAMAFVFGLILSGLVTAIALGALVVVVPLAYVLRRRTARLKEFQRQLPDTLTLLAGAMRAGFSFMQGLETVADESSGAMRREMQRVFTETRLGRPVEAALNETAERMGSNDLAWAVMAIGIQREVGGNLATLLDTVADTMSKRERLRREVQALTAEGRFSGLIVSLFAPIFGGFLFLANREYIQLLFSTTMGIVAVVVAGALSVVGWFWLKQLVKIEV